MNSLKQAIMNGLKIFVKTTVAILLSIIAHSGLAQNTDIDVPIGWAAVSGNGVDGTIGGANGQTVTATTTDDFIKYVGSSETLIIKVEGTLIGDNAKISVTSNKTIIGVGDSATLIGLELNLSGVSNVIIRNLFIKGARDAIALRRTHHVWIDHCDVSACFDGLIDISDKSNYNTVSWTRFSNHDKTMLINSGTDHDDDIGTLNTTLHHNWWDGSNQRNPRAGYGMVHVFNCHYSGNGFYGIGLHSRCLVKAENNHFENMRSPILQMYRPDPSSVYHGFCESVNNIMIGCREHIDDEGVSFRVNDYYLHNFLLDPVANVPSVVKENAGPSAAFSALGLLPIPGNGAVIQSNNPLLKWTKSENATEYIVSFGSSFPLTEVARVREQSYQVSNLEPGSVYYWSIDQVTASGIVKGKVWQFRNGAISGQPYAKITAPIGEILINATDEVTITTEVSDPDGNKLKVEFYEGKKLLGTDETAPYSFSMKNVTEGSHILYVKVIDEDGKLYVSDFVVPVVKHRINGLPDGYDWVANNGATCSFGDVMNVAYGSNGDYTYLFSVTGNVGCSAATFGVAGSGNGNSCYATKTSSPYVGLMSPTTGKTYKEPASISIFAKAADNEGDIDSIKFFNDEDIIGTSKMGSNGVANFVWKNVQAGQYNLTARVTDKAGHTTMSPVSRVLVEEGTGIHFLNNETITVFPNPVSEILTLNMGNNPENSIATLTTLKGEIILEKRLNGGSNWLDLKGLPSGTYLLTISNSEATYAQKIVKQ